MSKKSAIILDSDDIVFRSCPQQEESWCSQKCAWYDARSDACAVLVIARTLKAMKKALPQ